MRIISVTINILKIRQVRREWPGVSTCWRVNLQPIFICFAIFLGSAADFHWFCSISRVGPYNGHDPSVFTPVVILNLLLPKDELKTLHDNSTSYEWFLHFFNDYRCLMCVFYISRLYILNWPLCKDESKLFMTTTLATNNFFTSLTTTGAQSVCFAPLV